MNAEQLIASSRSMATALREAGRIEAANSLSAKTDVYEKAEERRKAAAFRAFWSRTVGAGSKEC